MMDDTFEFPFKLEVTRESRTYGSDIMELKYYDSASILKFCISAEIDKHSHTNNAKNLIALLRQTAHRLEQVYDQKVSMHLKGEGYE